MKASERVAQIEHDFDKTAVFSGFEPKFEEDMRYVFAHCQKLTEALEHARDKHEADCALIMDTLEGDE